MSAFKKLAAVASVSILGLILALILAKKGEVAPANPPSAPSLPQKNSTLKEIATRPVKLNLDLRAQKNDSVDDSTEIVLPQDVPDACRNPETIKQIVATDLDTITEKERNPAEQACLQELGAPPACLARSGEGDDDHRCLNNLIIARSRLIDKMSKNAPSEDLDSSVLANKIIARIYSKVPMDESGLEIFDLADKLVALNSDSAEAHNVRSYFAVQAFKKDFSRSTLGKGRESASFLEQSPDPESLRLGLIYQFGYALIEYVTSNDRASLEVSESYAKDYLSRYPDRLEGFYMMATIEGYKRNLEACRKWLQKGLDVGGPSQTGYEDYRSIVKSIDAGTFTKESLGVRFDSSSTFAPENILH